MDESTLPAVEAVAAEAIEHAGRARDFVLFSTGQCVSSIGTWMQKTTFGWLTWELTHSPAWVGAMGLADIVALIWVGPLAGVLTDRSNPLKLLSTTQTALLLLSTTLFVVAVTGWISIWALWLFALADSTLQGFNQPVRMTAINLLAGKQRISQAVAINSIAANLARSIGPMVAGVMIAGVGASYVFAVDALSFLAMLAAIWWLRDKLDRDVEGVGAPLGGAIMDGFRAVFHHPPVRAVFLMTVGIALFARPFFDMLPAFAGGVFGGGAHMLASLLSAQGVGALLGALWMLRRRDDATLARIALGAGILLCLVIFLFCRAGSIAIALPLMMATGAAHVSLNIAMQSLMQLRATAATRGRVMSLYSLMFRTGPSIGALVIGVTATHLPLGSVVAASAILGAVTVIMAGAGTLRGRAARP